MKRLYVSTADFRAPFDPIPFQGLGQDPAGDPRWHRPAPPRRWPSGKAPVPGRAKRTYWETAYFRAPYRTGYYQDNSLAGLAGTGPSVDVLAIQSAVGAPRTGVWDSPTIAAVRATQKRLGLPETGAPDVTLLAGLGLVTIAQKPPTALDTSLRDVRTAFNQVPPWAYLVGGGLLIVLGYRSYRKWKGQPAT